MVGGGSGNNTSGKNLRMKKLNLICLIFCYQTTYHKVVVKLQHSVAEIWGRFEDFFWQFFHFSQSFSENFGQQVRVINQSKKLVQYLMSMFRFHGLIFRSHISKKFWYREKMSSLRLCTDCKIFQFNGTVQKFWVLRKITGC